jgi:tRNA uridine 5-carboxymethylaminomethyl modification enzyme
LRRPETAIGDFGFRIADLAAGASAESAIHHPQSAIEWPRDVLEAVIVDAKYEGYLAKQERLVALQRSLDSKRIPPDLDYASIKHLRTEAKEKLSAFQPTTLGHASRIAGITPADITVLQVFLKRDARS